MKTTTVSGGFGSFTKSIDNISNIFLSHDGIEGHWRCRRWQYLFIDNRGRFVDFDVPSERVRLFCVDVSSALTTKWSTEWVRVPSLRLSFTIPITCVFFILHFLPRRSQILVIPQFFYENRKTSEWMTQKMAWTFFEQSKFVGCRFEHSIRSTIAASAHLLRSSENRRFCFHV